MQADPKYTTYIILFICYINKYYIISKNKVDISEFDILLTCLDKFDFSFILKININSNIMIRSY